MPLALLLTLTLVGAVPRSPRVGAVPEAVRPRTAGHETSTVVVREYDAARTPTSQRRQAEQVVSHLLGSVGVLVEWKVCGAALVDGRDECADRPDPRELIVRLARGSAASPAVLGFAFAPGIVATALVDRIQETARRTRQPLALLLGAVMTHELVHLLLGPESHAGEGVMRAEWTDQDIQLGGIWTLSLTADQQRVISASIRERLDASQRNALTDDCGC